MDEDIRNGEVFEASEEQPAGAGYESTEAEAARPEPEVVGVETKKCKYCGRDLNIGFDFCTYCGKSQKDIPAVMPDAEKEAPKAAREQKKAKKFDSPVLFVFAMVSFVLAAAALLTAFAKLARTGVPAGSNNPFGGFFSSGDNSEILISIAGIITYLLTSVIFTVTGFFLMILRKMK